MDPAFYKLLEAQIQESLKDLEELDEFCELVHLTDPNACPKENTTKLHGGSVLGKKGNLQRKRHEGHRIIYEHYFAPNSMYSDSDFKRRFLMSRRLFLRIMVDVCAHDPYFLQKRDATNLLGLSPLQKLTLALRQLALGIYGDATDEYCRLGESTALECLYHFVRAIREVYESIYLRKPSVVDFVTNSKVNAGKGFPGMFGSFDCMDYAWKNCPVAWHGQFTNKDKDKSIILEVVADHELWIWHAFFGLLGGNHDINVLDRSPLVNDWLHNGRGELRYLVNGVEYISPYLLVDGIYPSWSIFQTTIHLPQTDKKSHFTKCQEVARKDIERAFGMLQARWAIVKNPARSWKQEIVIDILMACVILHNMILEDERGQDLEDLAVGCSRIPIRRPPLPWSEYLAETQRIESESLHFKLKNDLIEHLWSVLGDSKKWTRDDGLD